MKMKRLAMVCLGFALAAQIIWDVLQLWHGSRSAAFLTRPLLFTIVFLLLLFSAGRVRGLALVGRWALAGAFFSALLHRFGDFGKFVVYTSKVNSFLPHSVAPTLAVIASILEILFCAMLFLGIKIRYAAAGCSILLFLFATAMTISGMEQFSWAVYVLSMGAWMLSTVDASLLSIDAYRRDAASAR